MREVYDPAILYVATLALGSAGLTAWSVGKPYGRSATPANERSQLAAITLLCALAAFLGTGRIGETLIAAAIAVIFTLGLKMLLPRLTMAGAIATTVKPLVLLFFAPWSYFLLSDLGFPGWALAACLVANALSFATIGFLFACELARDALLTHGLWRRPNRPVARPAGASPRRVSIHLPCYAEPPELVIATIDRLARLDYPDFEVLVCDNNTEDESLWRPIGEYCARLNRSLGFERFRFFHVAPLSGAKAGALNFCLERMCPGAELVAVIDADYLARPDFLDRLVGFFDDPRVGYVQTPHDYRGFSDSAYLRACYWEYMPTNKLDLASINEYGAAFTIGTMCLIRAAALRQIGGWAEWCLTEDSEVSVRLRAIGCEGVYVRETFGRGLIPESFGDYKKQRFRWAAGPVQQLRRHWRLYLPQPFGRASALDGWSKLLELQRGVEPLLGLLATTVGLVVGLAGILLTATGAMPALALPDAAWAALALLAGSVLVRRWQRYRLSGCTRLIDMLGAELAKASLTWVQMVAALAGLSAKPQRWRRTPKFGARPRGGEALHATLPETFIGIGHVVLLGVPIGLGDRLGGHLTAMLTIALVVSAARFFAAPLMALLGGRQAAAAHAAEETIEGIVAKA